MIINLVFFAIGLIAGIASGNDWFTSMNAMYPIGTTRFGWWQILTSMFVHGGWWHLFANMWSLMIFGPAIEEIYGRNRTIYFYLLCGIGSALAHQLCWATGIIPEFTPYDTNNDGIIDLRVINCVVGASGAIYGIMAAAAMNFPNAKMFIIPFPFPIKLKWLVAAFCAWDLYSGLSGRDGVAHFAHIGGLIVGLIIILIWKYWDQNHKSSSNNYWTSSNSYSNYDKGDNNSVMDKVKDAFKKKPKMTIVKNAGDHQADYEYNERKKAHNEEIDRILDKVRKGGFENLTEEEKRTLFDASKR